MNNTTLFNPHRYQWFRQLHKTAQRHSSSSSRPIHIRPSPQNLTGISAFREQAFNLQKPFLFARDAGSAAARLPAATKWFHQVDADNDANTASPWALAAYMNQFQEYPFPYELVVSSAKSQQALVAFRDWLVASKEPTDCMLAGILEASLAELGTHTFFQLFAPLRILTKALEFNRLQHLGQLEPVVLYIAQSSLPDLPKALLDDLPTPELVLHAGKGDVYNSSVWLGTEPTYTPLHRDPNPNLFCQLCNTKLIRLMPPAIGDRLYFEVQVRIRQQGNSRIRTVDMMEGNEREALHAAVWTSDPIPDQMYEAELEAGDSLFIPNGWWHSVKSKGSHGHLNASVNWWFR